ncbi:PadR family transcriptional regulator [Actinoplanes sp. NPDC051633]|uniref:PadR family transcriptional regulator n=1 Tax=Actinoplanes sp. NPDC051633 TaxID=3155670 RepID=UPI00342EC9F0
MDRDRRAQWLRGVLDLCVLGALAGGESYGYQIAQRLEVGGLGPIAGGTLYPTLLRLEKVGLIRADWRGGEGGPARKYYRLSDEGAATLRESSREWSGFVGVVNAFLEVAAP